MFASLKNKIREEIGSDVSAVVRNAGTVRGINSKHSSQIGSTSSIGGSQISLDDSREDNATSPSSPLPPKRENSFEIKQSDGGQLLAKDAKRLESRKEEWIKRLAKNEAELVKRLEKKEEEWQIKMSEKEKEWQRAMEKQEKERARIEEERERAENAKRDLELALRNTEESKKKLYALQEDAEQLKGFQTQEMAKIKHLLLAKEQEVEEKSHHLKVALGEVDSLKVEVSRLRRYENELNRIQESASEEIKNLQVRLEESATKLDEVNGELSRIGTSYEAERASNATLNEELEKLKANLERERETSASLAITMEREKSEKDSALLRNAQVSQDYELAKRENGQQRAEALELQNKIESMTETLSSRDLEIEKSSKDLEEARARIAKLEETENERRASERTEEKLKNSLADMEEQLNDKTKTIKVLQQRLADMKKTLQRELRVPSSSLDSDAEPTAAILNPSSSQTVTARNPNLRDDDVNFKYLKHVLIKFLTSREYEALHLTRAVATLLHFSPEEERLLQETLEWKMSWFGSRPNLGNGQTAKAIPPS